MALSDAYNEDMPEPEDKGYLGNPLLKRVGTKSNLSIERQEEIAKCAADPIYFAETYIKIVHVDHGLIPLKLYDYQKEIIRLALGNRNTAINGSRQLGKCLVGDTRLRVRNTVNKTEEEISIENLFNRSKFHKVQ